MLDGKNVAFKIFYEALDGVSQKIDDSESIKVWEKALKMLCHTLLEAIMVEQLFKSPSN